MGQVVPKPMLCKDLWEKEQKRGGLTPSADVTREEEEHLKQLGSGGSPVTPG